MHSTNWRRAVKVPLDVFGTMKLLQLFPTQLSLGSAFRHIGRTIGCDSSDATSRDQVIRVGAPDYR